MTLERFTNYINLIQEQSERECRLHSALEEITDGRFIVLLSDEIESALLEMIDDYFGDMDNTTSYWLYELDQKRKDAELEGKFSFFVNDIPIPLRTIEDLYTYLMSIKH